MEEPTLPVQKIRVFLVSKRSMFGIGIENLLHQEPTVEIVGCEEASEETLEHIKELAPNVTILIGNESPIDLCRLLRETAGIKVIGLNLDNNSINIFHGEQRCVQTIQDLLQAISTHTTSSTEN